MGIVVHGQELAAPEGLVVKNFLGNPEAVFRFKNQARAHDVHEVVVHETVTTSWQSTVNVLKARGLGVHFIADTDGTIYQHADLQDDMMWHASQHNGMSVGIETVNPFDPKLLPKQDSPWDNVIDAPWAGGKYVVPTILQAEAVCKLLNWLTSADANPLAIPQLWPGVNGGKLALGRVPATSTPPNPGILAHMYFDHGDGAWLVLYAWLRLEAKLGPPEAYAEATSRATGVKMAGSVDLSDLITANPDLCHS